MELFLQKDGCIHIKFTNNKRSLLVDTDKEVRNSDLYNVFLLRTNSYHNYQKPRKNVIMGKEFVSQEALEGKRYVYDYTPNLL